MFPSDAVVDPPQIIPTDDPYEDPSQTAISIPDPIVTDPAVTDPTVIDPEILGDTVPDLPATGPPVTDPLTSDPPLPTDNEQASSYPVPSVTSSEEASVSSAASSSTLSVKSTSIRVITTTLPPKSPEEYEDPPSTTETAGETVRPSPELVTGNGNSMHGSLGWICALSGIVASHYLL